MARVTVEDCILKVPNRFDLVMLAAQRARDVASGAALTVERDNDKNPVVALREIADETIDLETLDESLVKGLQRQVEIDEPEEDVSDLDLPEATEDLADQSPDPLSLAAPEDEELSSPEEVPEEAPEEVPEEVPEEAPEEALELSPEESAETPPEASEDSSGDVEDEMPN